MKQIHMLVKGRVQGVGFRYTIQQQALEIGINGWVKNLENGDVEVVAEGQKDDIEQFISIIKQGPSRFSKVNHVNVTESTHPDNFATFEIRY